MLLNQSISLLLAFVRLTKDFMNYNMVAIYNVFYRKGLGDRWIDEKAHCFSMLRRDKGFIVLTTWKGDTVSSMLNSVMLTKINIAVSFTMFKTQS